MMAAYAACMLATMAKPKPPAKDSEIVRIASRETMYQGHFRLDRYLFRHRRHDGAWSVLMAREVPDRGEAVAVLLYDPKRDAVVLTEQFRLPAYLAGMAPRQIETAAGLIDKPGEDREAVARREVREETGAKIAGELVPAHRVMPSPGGLSEVVSIYCAEIDSRKVSGIHGVAAEGEDIRVVVLPFEDAMKQLRGDAIGNSTCAVALYWLNDNRERLKTRWLKSAGSRGSPRKAPARKKR
jgi:ADP-ribose pyrophosphatase